jgi:glutamate carboxypeptidase
MTSFLDAGAIDTEAVLADIRRLVEIESPTGSRTGVNGVLDAIGELFAGTGASLERQMIDATFGDVLCVRCDAKRSEPGILVLSHVDTVHPLGTIERDLPYRQDGDRVYGPGIYDMKGCLVSAVAAWRRINAAGITTPLPVTFLFTPDEEVGSPASRPLIEAEAARNTFVLVTEPARAGGRIVTARKGVGRFMISATGVPAHAGANHDRGHSAIRAMAQVILEIEAFTDYRRGITTNVGMITGGTGVNVIPHFCQIEADLRVRDTQSGVEMVEKFHALRVSDPGVRLSVRGGLNRPPFERNPGIDNLFSMARQVAADIGFDLRSVELAGGGSDGNFTVAKGIPTLDGLGLDGDGAHTHDEHILISSIIERGQLLQGLMERLLPPTKLPSSPP